MEQVNRAPHSAEDKKRTAIRSQKDSDVLRVQRIRSVAETDDKISAFVRHQKDARALRINAAAKQEVQKRCGDLADRPGNR